MPIRPLVDTDLPQVLDLWQDLLTNGQAVHPEFTPSDQARQVFEPWARAQWTRQNPFPMGWLAQEQGAIVGFLAGMIVARMPVLATPPTARITDVYVVPQARGRGLGTQLVQVFRDRAKRAGYPRLEVDTLAADHRALAFWQACGFADWMVTLAFDKRN